MTTYSIHITGVNIGDAQSQINSTLTTPATLMSSTTTTMTNTSKLGVVLVIYCSYVLCCNTLI